MKKREIFFFVCLCNIESVAESTGLFFNTSSVYGHISLNLFLGVSFIFDLIFCFVAAVYFNCWPYRVMVSK